MSTSASQALKDYGVDLLEHLPLENETFFVMAETADLFPLDTGNNIQAKGTRAQKVLYFLGVIKPGANHYLPKLLKVMNKSGVYNVVELAKKIAVATGIDIGTEDNTDDSTVILKPISNLTIARAVDCHRLLWQELNKKFCNSPTKVFVMAVGQQLSSCDYDITHGNAELAAQKTFELVNHTITCSTNYSPTGSLISTMWKRLPEEKGPKAGPKEQPAFQQAKRALFKNYVKQEPTELYQGYLKKEIALNKKEQQIKEECQKDGDQWKVKFDGRLQSSEEYKEFQHAAEVVKAHLDAIKVWEHGPLVHKLNSIEQALTENARFVYDNSNNRLDYYHVSLQPADWYQWFDQFPHEDRDWMQINVDSKNDDDDQAALYEKLGGSITKHHSLNKQSDVKISFKVRSVQINRPWLDLSVLNYTVSSESTGSWSTGELSADNKGTFPLLSTQMIVARDITVTASTKMDQGAINDACSLFAVGSDSYKTINNNSIELKGTQVIGYVCTVVPKYPR